MLRVLKKVKLHNSKAKVYDIELDSDEFPLFKGVIHRGIIKDYDEKSNLYFCKLLAFKENDTDWYPKEQLHDINEETLPKKKFEIGEKVIFKSYNRINTEDNTYLDGDVEYVWQNGTIEYTDSTQSMIKCKNTNTSILCINTFIRSWKNQ